MCDRREPEMIAAQRRYTIEPGKESGNFSRRDLTPTALAIIPISITHGHASELSVFIHRTIFRPCLNAISGHFSEVMKG